MAKCRARFTAVTYVGFLVTAACGGSFDDAATAKDALVEPIAASPPMGWNSWNTYGCAIDESLIKRQADAMVSSGMRDVGYRYINIDDCWMATTRDANGNFKANPTTFPSGIKSLADYVHARGLKLGIYSSPGPQTCVGRTFGTGDKHPGSAGHEQADAQIFAAWGVDYLKYDRCTATKEEVESKFALMRDALIATGRPIVYSINPDGATGTKPWSTYANLWRTTPDIDPVWKKGIAQGWWSVGILDIIDINAAKAADASVGRWNDPDMLEVGVRKSVFGRTMSLSDEEGRAHFSLWAMMAAPLIAGNDLTTMSAATKATLTNTEIIALDQDPMGVQGTRVSSDGTREVWKKPLTGGAVAVALFNRGSRATTVTVKWADVGLAVPRIRARNLWTHTELGNLNLPTFSISVPSHGAVVLSAAAAP